MKYQELNGIYPVLIKQRSEIQTRTISAFQNCPGTMLPFHFGNLFPGLCNSQRAYFNTQCISSQHLCLYECCSTSCKGIKDPLSLLCVPEDQLVRDLWNKITQYHPRCKPDLSLFLNNQRLSVSISLYSFHLLRLISFMPFVFGSVSDFKSPLA